MTVMDRNGTVMARHPAAENCEGRMLPDLSLLRRILNGKEDVFEMTAMDGVSRLYAVTHIEDDCSPRLYVCVEMPLAVSFARANALLLWNTLILSLVLLSVFAAARLYARRFFLRPVNALVVAACWAL